MGIYLPFLPALVVLLGAFVVLMVGVFRGDRSFLALTLFSCFVLATAAVLECDISGRATFFNDALIFDAFARFMIVGVLIASLTALVLSLSYLERVRLAKPEYPALLLFSTLGLILMVSAHDLLAVYLGLELASLPFYILAGFRRDQVASNEAGVKYFVLGALSSGIMLYGISLLYGETGGVDFVHINHMFSLAAPTKLSVLALGFVLVGFLFKISAVPFHMWMPDIFEGAPTSVAAFLSSAPKIAGLAVLARFLVEPAFLLSPESQQILLACAVASMSLGSFAGVAQHNLKRLMAYSAINNVGFMILALGIGSLQGFQAALIYMVLYVFATLGAFSVILCLRKRGRGALRLADLAGLGKEQPLLALSMAVFMFSLAGVPPLAGFFGKYFVLIAAVQAGFWQFALVGVLTSVVAAFYYLRIVKIMYFDDAKQPIDPVPEYSLKCVMVILAVLLTLYVFEPSWLIDASWRAAQTLTGIL